MLNRNIKNLHLFLSPIENESRLMKEMASLIKLNIVDNIIVLGISGDGLPLQQYIDDKRQIIRVKLPQPRKNAFRLESKFITLLKSLIYTFASLKYSIKIKPQFISCHNLALLPLAGLAKKMVGSKLIYVPHELETERTGLTGIFKKLAQWTEPQFIKYADAVVTVCQPIASWYEKHYNIPKVYVLRNVPVNPINANTPLVKTTIFREKFSIPKEHIIFIYQGIIDPARGILELIDNFKRARPDRHLILMGYGSSENYVKKVAQQIPNIHFQAAVPQNDIIQYTSSADVGIFYIPSDNISLSYRYSLPNKFFEYLIGGLPVMISDNLEYLSELIEENDLGWILSRNNEAFINFINSLTQEQINAKLENGVTYSRKSGWQFEESILKEIYN